MGVGMSMAGAMMQAKAAKEQARRQQEMAMQGLDPYGLLSGVSGIAGQAVMRQPVRQRSVVKCQNCGANYWQGEPCEYCGPRPSVPVVRRRLTNTK